MPHLGTIRTGFLQMIQDLQFVFDSIAEVPGEFLVYNKRCSDEFYFFFFHINVSFEYLKFISLQTVNKLKSLDF